MKTLALFFSNYPMYYSIFEVYQNVEIKKHLTKKEILFTITLLKTMSLVGALLDNICSFGSF